MSMIMKATALACLFSVWALFGTQAHAADAATDVAALHAADQAWLKAYNGNDPASAAALYDENAVFMPPGAPSVIGRAAIKAYFTTDMDGVAKQGVKFHLGDKPAGGASGDLGWASGSYSVTDKAGKVVETGKYLSVSKKAGGKWLYVRDTYNADAPPAK
ncbi:MAG: DUF4440 domain-containing protein [Rudaea sp.]